MHPLLEEFCDKWVWPTMPAAPGAEFRLRLTRDHCLKGWSIGLERTLADIEEELKTNDEAVDVILEAIDKAGYKAGKDVAIALDPAASELFQDGAYTFWKSDKSKKTSAEMVEFWTITGESEPFS